MRNETRSRERKNGAMSVRGGDILTSREARELLKIGKTKLHDLTHHQIVPAYRIGSGKTSSLRYRRVDLLEWLYSQKV